MLTRGVAYCILIVFSALSIALIAARPDWVGDDNSFLKNFVNHEFLNVLGVTLAITLASAANIHLAFNKIEEEFNSPDGLAGSRVDLRRNAFALILLFIVAVALVIIKPIAATAAASQGFFNLSAILILLWHVLLLSSLVQLVFAIPPHFKSATPHPGPPATGRQDTCLPEASQPSQPMTASGGEGPG